MPSKMLQALLRFLLRRLTGILHIICHWTPRARLRRLLSILGKCFPNRHLDSDVTVDGLPSEDHVVEICCSAVPSSAAASQTPLPVPSIVLENMEMSPSRSRNSSRAPSIRSMRNFQSAYGDEERRSRARAITAEQSQEREVVRPHSRVAVSASRSRSRSRAPAAARPSHSNSPTRTHSEHSLSRTSTRVGGGTRPGTPTYPPVHPNRPVSLEMGYGVERSDGPDSRLINSLNSSHSGPPTLEITTTIVPPSPTSPTSSGQPESAIDNTFLRPDARQSLESSAPGISAATSPTAYDGDSDAFPDIPSPPPGRYLHGITPDGLPRYKRRATTEKVKRNHELRPYTREFPHTVPASKTPVGSLGPWKPFTHAEGALYFCHPGKRIWTNAYMYEELYFVEVEECVALLEQAQQGLLEDGITLPDDCELVIEITKTEHSKDNLLWHYYYVDHSTQTIFWLHKHILWEEIATVQGNLSPDHIRHKIQQFYWHHIFHFPGGRNTLSTYFGKDVWSELLSFMDFNALDTIISPRSTSFFSHLELMHMKKMVKHAYDQSKEASLLPAQLSAVARIQMIMAEQRFLHAHGQPYVRLKNNDSIHPDKDSGRTRSWLFYVIGFALFRTPFTLLEDLHNVSVDGIVQEYAWRKYFKRLLDDWDRLILQGTVILTANVSFLAIPDVIHFPGQPSGTGGDSQIQPWIKPLFNWSALLSYISTLLALGSVMAGLLLARLNRSQVEQSTDAGVACDYIDHHTSVIFGLEPIAIIYSLPYAMLLWGVGFFFAALLSFTFNSTDTATRVVVGAGAVVVTALLLWSILSGKLMILNKLWPLIENSMTYERVMDAMSSAMQIVRQGRCTAVEKMVSVKGSISAHLKEAAASVNAVFHSTRAPADVTNEDDESRRPQETHRLPDV